MDILVVVLVLAIAAVAALVVAWPLLRGTVETGTSPSVVQAQRQAIDEELQQTLTAIKEIQFDRDAGHLSDEDFAALDGDERARAIELMRRRDALTRQLDDPEAPG